MSTPDPIIGMYSKANENKKNIHFYEDLYKISIRILTFEENIFNILIFVVEYLWI